MIEDVAAGVAEGGVKAAADALHPLQWLQLTIGSVLCVVVCLLVGGGLGLPTEPGFNGSLLAGPAAGAGLLKVAVVIAAALAAGTLVASFAEDEGALFCAAVGLGATAVRAGPIRPTLVAAGGRGVFVTLAAEVVVEFALLAGGWWVLRRVFDRVRGPAARGGRKPMSNELAAPDLGQRFGTLLTAVLATTVCLFVLVPNGTKSQAIGGVAVAGFVGAIVAYTSTPLAQGVWYWAAPATLAVLAYLLATVFGAAALPVGDLVGWVAPLARPTPLDYAGVGTAGALFGYWTARRMYEPPPDEATAEPA